jgi:hypothetical protein
MASSVDVMKLASRITLFHSVAGAEQAKSLLAHDAVRLQTARAPGGVPEDVHPAACQTA